MWLQQYRRHAYEKCHRMSSHRQQSSSKNNSVADLCNRKCNVSLSCFQPDDNDSKLSVLTETSEKSLQSFHPPWSVSWDSSVASG